MKEQEIYIDNVTERRNFFQRYFPLKVGKKRAEVNSEDILKNSCPVCGYLTLDERDSSDICGICFWEDDGIDDVEGHENSGPNHITLKEGRTIFEEAKRKLFNANHGENNLLDELRSRFLTLDGLIEQNNPDKSEILRQQSEIIDLLTKNKVYGLGNLWSK